MPQRVSKDNFQSEVLSADTLVLADFYSELASEYEVQAAPTLVFFKNGEEKERLRGAVKKSEIIEVTEKLIKE